MVFVSLHVMARWLCFRVRMDSSCTKLYISYQIRKESSAKWYHLMQAVLQESAGSKVREMYLKLTLRRPEQDIEQEIEQQSTKY